MKDELREKCIIAIKNYMHDRLFEVTGDTSMLPFFEKQANELMNSVDNAIEQTKQHAKRIKLAN